MNYIENVRKHLENLKVNKKEEFYEVYSSLLIHDFFLYDGMTVTDDLIKEIYKIISEHNEKVVFDKFIMDKVIELKNNKQFEEIYDFTKSKNYEPYKTIMQIMNEESDKYIKQETAEYGNKIEDVEECVVETFTEYEKD